MFSDLLPDVMITVGLCVLLRNRRVEVQASRYVSIPSFKLEGSIWPHDRSFRRQHASNHTEYYYILRRAVYFVHVTLFLLKFSDTMLTSEFRAVSLVGIVIVGLIQGSLIDWEIIWLPFLQYAVRRNTLYPSAIDMVYGKGEQMQPLFRNKALREWFCSSRKFPPRNAQLAARHQTGRGPREPINGGWYYHKCSDEYYYTHHPHEDACGQSLGSFDICPLANHSSNSSWRHGK